MSTNALSYFARGLASSALLAVAALSSAQFSLNVVAFPIKPAYSGTNPSIAIPAGAIPTDSTARAVNSLGQVAGNATYSVGAPQGLYTGATGASPVGVASSAPSGAASLGFTALSSNGFGAGTASFAVGASSDKRQAFRYSGGTVTPLGTFGYNGTSTGAGVNASGTVVGDSINPAGNDRGFYATVGGGLVDIGTLPGGTDSAALAINDAGTIVGSASAEDGTNRAIIYQGGNMKELAPMVSSGFTFYGPTAAALSQSGGFIVGNSFASTPDFSFFGNRAFLNTGASATSAGTTVVIPFLYNNKGMTVTGVNSLGWAVGFTTNTSNANTGFLYANGALIDLSTLLPAGYSFGAASITGITDNGYLSATLVGPGSTGSFAALLQITPQAVPEPTTLAALGLGALVVLRRRRRA